MIKPVVNVNKIGSIDNVRYKVGIEPYKKRATKLFSILFSLSEVQSSRVFDAGLNKAGIDISFCNDSTIKSIQSNRCYNIRPFLRC